MPKRRQFGEAGTPSKWRAMGQSNIAGRLAAQDVGAESDGVAVSGTRAVDKENALTLISSTDKELALEKLQCQPSSPSGNCVAMAAAAAAWEDAECDPLGSRRKRVEEVRSAPAHYA